MELALLIAVLFLTTVVLILGITFIYLAFKIFNIDTNVIPNKEQEDKFTDETKPLDQFMPDPTKKLGVKYSSRDVFTKI